MDRLAADDARISDWATRVVMPVVERPSEPEPDPEVLLEQQRQRLFEQAREEGCRLGLQRAEEVINARIRQAEERITDLHAAESARLQDANSRLTTLLGAIPEAITRIEAQVESASIEIAFAGIARLLGERHAEGSLIAQVCTQALVDHRQRPVALRLCPDDVQQIQSLPEGEGVTLVADRKMASGQCRLEGHKGLFDTGIDVRLEALKQALLRSLDETMELT